MHIRMLSNSTVVGGGPEVVGEVVLLLERDLLPPASERQRAIVRVSEREREGGRKREIVRVSERERGETERERNAERDRKREGESELEREREREKEAGRQSESESGRETKREGAPSLGQATAFLGARTHSTGFKALPHSTALA